MLPWKSLIARIWSCTSSGWSSGWSLGCGIAVTMRVTGTSLVISTSKLTGTSRITSTSRILSTSRVTGTSRVTSTSVGNGGPAQPMTYSAPKTQIIAIRGLNILSSRIRQIDSFNTKDTVSRAWLLHHPNCQAGDTARICLQVA